MVTASDRFALNFSLSGGEKNDSPEGLKLLYFTPYFQENKFHKWNYDRELYKRRNEIERFFRRLKRFRRIFTRYDKLDILYSGFIMFAMIVDSLV